MRKPAAARAGGDTALRSQIHFTEWARSFDARFPWNSYELMLQVGHVGLTASFLFSGCTQFSRLILIKTLGAEVLWLPCVVKLSRKLACSMAPDTLWGVQFKCSPNFFGALCGHASDNLSTSAPNPQPLCTVASKFSERFSDGGDPCVRNGAFKM